MLRPRFHLIEVKSTNRLLLSDKDNKRYRDAYRNRRNACGLLIAAILLFTAPLVVSAVLFARTQELNLDSPLERQVGLNVSDYLDQQIGQNGTIDDLQMTLMHLEMQLANLNMSLGINGTTTTSTETTGDGGLSFLNATFTRVLSCPVRFASNCGSPSLAFTAGYNAFPAGNGGTISVYRMETAHAQFVYAEFGNWTNNMTFVSGATCNFAILVDLTCWSSGFFNGAYIDYWWSYRPNPIVYPCNTPCVNPQNVLMYRAFQVGYTPFLFSNVLQGGPRPVTIPIADIHMFLSTTFI